MTIDIESMTDEQYEDYREFCDSRSSAEFRFRRETCGIELSEISDDLGVRLDTVKRWENPRKGSDPSIRAWAYVDSAFDRLADSVESAISEVEDSDDGLGETRPFRITYRRGNARTEDGQTVGRANALAMATATSLSALGYDVAIEWADA